MTSIRIKTPADASRARSKAEHVSLLLLERIIEAGIEPGRSFATEADLLDQLDVSRPTLREGLRILESQGVLALRPGPKGGIIVQRPPVDMLAHSLSIFLRLHEVPFGTVLKAREVIEPALAAEAATNGADGDFDELAASIRRMKALGADQDGFIEENRVFHSVIARASGNKVLEVFWSTISIVASGENQGIKYSIGNRQHVIDAHERILDACRLRDGVAAAAEMDRHVTALEHMVRNRYRHLLDQTTGVVARRRNGAT